MLALVTCHIFPPSIWYGKKWIPGTWLPGWQLAVFQSPRLHECGPADAHGNAQPFCMDKCIFRKKRLFCNLATRWNKILQFVPSFPIYGWLTWWCDFFPVGSAFEDHPQEFGQKKVQPLGLYFWYLRLGLFKSPFFGWWSWRYVVVPFCKDKCIFSKKHMCCNLRARWHKILEFVPSCPICGWLAWWCDFFPVGPTFEDHPQVFSQKRSSPLNFIFDTCASASWSHLFWLVKLNICGCTPFARTNVFSEKKNACFAIWAHVGTKFLNSSHHALSVDDWPGDGIFFLWGQPLKIIPQVFSQKKVQPLGFYFWPLRLGLFKSLFWLVKLNMCVCTLLQSHVKNHTPSSNHGTFFPGVWHLDMF